MLAASSVAVVTSMRHGAVGEKVVGATLGAWVGRGVGSKVARTPMPRASGVLSAVGEAVGALAVGITDTAVVGVGVGTCSPHGPKVEGVYEGAAEGVYEGLAEGAAEGERRDGSSVGPYVVPRFWWWWLLWW